MHGPLNVKFLKIYWWFWTLQYEHKEFYNKYYELLTYLLHGAESFLRS